MEGLRETPIQILLDDERTRNNKKTWEKKEDDKYKNKKRIISQDEQGVGIQGHIKKSKSLAVNHYLAAANYTPC